MTELPIPSGPTNREIIERAYQILGLSDSMFGRTPEELASAMLPLGGLMAQWPYDLLGFIVEDVAGMRAEEESGISRAYLEPVAYGLAERLAPTIGKSMSREAMKAAAREYSRLCGAVATIAEANYADATFRGAGGQRRSGAYFPKA
jgi:hypothetical protein